MVQVSEFSSTSLAYDEVQCREEIGQGSVLVIESEGVVGLAWAWPMAITVACGELHEADPGRLKEVLDEFAQPEQIQAAIAKARELGLAIHPELEE